VVTNYGLGYPNLMVTVSVLSTFQKEKY